MAATVMAANAQQLSTEVVVDRNIVPEERVAVRPTWLMPVVVLPEASPIMLTPVTYTALSPINRDYTAFSAAEGAFAAEKTPYRGYIGGGYFPTLDFGLSAGYRVIDKKNMTLAAHVQFDTERYRPYGEPDDMGRQYFVDGNAGVDFAWRPKAGKELSASAGYNFLREKTTYWHPQNVNSGVFGIKWASESGKVPYSIGLRTNFESASDTYKYLVGLDERAMIEGLNQQQMVVDGSVGYVFGASAIGVTLKADMVHTSVEHSPTKGYFDFTPHYSYRNDKFAAHIGVKLDISDSFGVMPDIRLQWMPVNVVGVWADVTGGSHSNTFASLRQESVYQVFEYQYGVSRIPVEVNGGVNIGPFKGFHAGVFGGYAVADNWLMMRDGVYTAFGAVDVKGWHAGAKIGAEWRFIKGEVKADFAPSGYDSAWYERRDRASSVITANVELTPLKPLTVRAGYEFRGGRKAYASPTVEVGLGCVSDLSAGAQWRFTDALSVFAHVENILGRRYMTVPWEPSRKVSGLVGVAYKF